MDYSSKKCPNMNHGRSRSMVKFCPTCGENLDTSPKPKCDGEKHSSRRKERDQFCMDCGLRLGS